MYFLYIHTTITGEKQAIRQHQNPSCPLCVCVCVDHPRGRITNIWYQSQVLDVAMASQSRSKQPLIGDGSGEEKVQPSRSPPCRRGRSHSHHSRNRNSGSRVIERIVERPSANVAWPMLTRTNYPEWALVMEVNFQTLRVWDAVHHGIPDDPDEVEYHDDRQAMSGLLRSVLSELWGTLATKDSAKQAWDAVRTLRIGDERTRDATAQQLRRNFANLTFKEGESVTDFGVRITALATNLRTLGDHISDIEVVKKLLQVAPKSLNQAAVSIEMFVDLNQATIEDVIGRLRVFEERAKPAQITDAMGRLMLCEEDWEARRKERREQENSGGGTSSGNRGKRPDRGRGRGSTPRNGRDVRNTAAGSATGWKPPPGTLCHNCGKGGHWAKDCRGKKKVVAHVAEAQEDEPALMYLAVETEEIAPGLPPALPGGTHVRADRAPGGPTSAPTASWGRCPHHRGRPRGRCPRAPWPPSAEEQAFAPPGRASRTGRLRPCIRRRLARAPSPRLNHPPHPRRLRSISMSARFSSISAVRRRRRLWPLAGGCLILGRRTI
jgi:hypothetical protein